MSAEQLELDVPEVSREELRQRVIVPLETDGMYPCTAIHMVNGSAYTVDMEPEQVATLLSHMNSGETDYLVLPDPQAVEPFVLWRDALKYVTICSRHWLKPADVKPDKFAEQRDISIARIMPPRSARRHHN